MAGLITFKSIDELREEYRQIPHSKFKVLLWNYATTRFKQFLQHSSQLPNIQRVLDNTVEKAIYIIENLSVESLDNMATFTDKDSISTITRAIWLSLTVYCEKISILFDDISMELKRRTEEIHNIEFLSMAIDNKMNILSFFDAKTEIWAYTAHNIAIYLDTRFL